MKKNLYKSVSLAVLTLVLLMTMIPMQLLSMPVSVQELKHVYLLNLNQLINGTTEMLSV